MADGAGKDDGTMVRRDAKDERESVALEDAWRWD